MRYTKANFAVQAAASTRRDEPQFYRVQLESDGSSVAADGQYVIAVGPVNPEREAMFVQNDESNVAPPPEGVGIDPKLARKVSQSIPSGKTSLGFAQLTRCDDARVELMTTDSVRFVKHREPPARRRFPAWRGVMALACKRASAGRAVVDLKGLIRVLNAVQDATKDVGKDVPVYIEFGDENDVIIIRTHNWVTAQRVMALVKPLKLPEGMEWLEPDEWEAGVRNAGTRRRRPAREE